MTARPVPPWAFPVSYLLHIADEAFFRSGFASWFSQTFGVRFAPSDFLVLNGAGLAVFVVAAGLAQARPARSAEIGAVLGSIVLCNGLLHVSATVLTSQLVPGVLTGTLLWIPIGTRGLVEARSRLPRLAFLRCLLVGLGIQAGVTALALQM